ncbi:MAG: DUF4139 domain-containing protein [Myxococcales bacterium]|nr:DUF4139 domain-containing protein [Myxococcales bacterium]
MRTVSVASMLLAGTLLSGCAVDPRAAFPSATASLPLDRVVLYRNGIGYFERRGEVDGDTLRIKVRKDQVNDLLKSLTIVDKKTGRALSVSMPLDPETWANAALASLAPGSGSLAHVLDLLRGVDVVLATVQGELTGRVVMVEQIADEPDPSAPPASRGPMLPPSNGQDHKITLIEGQELKVMRLSKVKSVTLKDGDLALQFHRRLDATAGEGMFQQIEVGIRLDGEVSSHDLVVSYVVEAPMWKPTYRVVLPEKGKGEALLQAWAVVDNISGEDWREVTMSLTAGAPLAFRYDLHTPRRVEREDVSGRVHGKRARVSLGEASYGGEAEDAKPEAPPAESAAAAYDYGMPASGAPPPAPGMPQKMRRAPMAKPMGGSGKKSDKRGFGASAGDDADDYGGNYDAARELRAALHRRRGDDADDYGGNYDRDANHEAAVTFEDLRRSTMARAKASAASGLTRFDLETRVTVPDGTSTMVAIVNEVVPGEETFLFKPGGAGDGYESNPYRVVRFKNNTPFVLESGPIAIFSGGSFVGEGISETVGSGTSVTIPFAVEPTIMVARESTGIPEELKLIKIVRGTLHIERFTRMKTVWKASSQANKDGFQVLVRHPRYAAGFQLKDKAPDLEELPDAYLVPLKVAKGSLSGTVELIEQQPMQTTIAILDARAVELLERVLVAGTLAPADRDKLMPVLDVRREIGKIDNEVNGLHRQQTELNNRADRTRQNIEAMERDKSVEAAALRRDLEKRLDEFTKDGDRLGREVVKLESRRLQLTVKLDDMLEGLTIGIK